LGPDSAANITGEQAGRSCRGHLDHQDVAGKLMLVAATGIRISEWDENKISIEQVFRRGEIVKRTKTHASKAPVPMCEALATTLNELRQQTPCSKGEDFVFASPTLNGKQPLWGQTMNANFVKPAAMSLGLVAEGERFGWHRFRHSLKHLGECSYEGHHGQSDHASSRQTGHDGCLHAWELR
jgi:integrase